MKIVLVKVQSRRDCDIPRCIVERRAHGTRLQAERFDSPPEGGTVVTASFLRKAKQGEEEESRTRIDPTAHLERDGICLIQTPDDSGDLDNLPELVMRVCPGLVRRDGDVGGVADDAVDSQRKSQGHLQAGKEHESEVTANGQR